MRCVQLLVFLSITACGAAETTTNAVPSPTPTPDASPTPTPTPTPEPLLESVELTKDLPVCAVDGTYDGHEIKIETPKQRQKCQDGVWVVTVPPEPEEKLTADEAIKRLRTIKTGDTMQTIIPEARDILLADGVALEELTAESDDCTPAVAGQQYHALSVVKYGLPEFDFTIKLRAGKVISTYVKVGAQTYFESKLCSER